jgi:hypothetical protein
VAERHSAEFDAPARLSCVSVDAVPKVRREAAERAGVLMM